ncbi:hypothetical protein Tco_1125062 [Tanacetum coccineum]|uniref:Uncharacterized protein n=1 Tax=Tanacetum coccineum TaxID=301880 RepID=A0ABQ5J7X4_9ASTR
METFIREFRTTNELLLKEQNNLLSDLRIEVPELSMVMNDVLLSRNEVKGITTRGGKMTSMVAYDKEINKANNDHNEPSGLRHDKPEVPREVVAENEPPKAQERIIQPTIKKQKPSIPFPNCLRKEKEEAQQRKFLENLKQLHINIPFIETLETQALLENEQLDSFLVNNMEKTITQMDQEDCDSIIEGFVDDAEVKQSIRRIDTVNTTYSVG